MRIERVEVEDLACFKQHSLEPGGLTLIHGDNRAGKSTLVYGLYFALFGEHLHRSLRAEDLCRKSAPRGRVTVDFHDERGVHRLARSTASPHEVERLTQVDGSWQPSPPDADASAALPASETAALTSFFREGELLYFLQDMPRYNKTLLHSMLEMEEVLGAQTRFKKALRLAKQQRDQKQRELAAQAVPDYALERLGKKVAEAEASLARATALVKQLAPTSAGARERELAAHQRKEAAEVKRALEAVRAERAAMATRESMEPELAALEQGQKDQPAPDAAIEQLNRRLGTLDETMAQAQQQRDTLSAVEQQARCPTCGQEVGAETVAEQRAALDAKLIEAQKGRETTAKELAELEQRRSKLVQERERAANLKTELERASKLEARITELERRAGELDKLLSQLAPDSADEPAAADRKQRLRAAEEEVSRLQQELVQASVAHAKAREAQLSSAKLERELGRAVRAGRCVQAACQAIKETLADFNSDLMAGVRGGLREWVQHFPFLSDFEIELGARELSPIIQARGYQYKLNQMSKSERVFLYLMLKLAIGDVLGHLGVFVLDDPADGLDEQRKQLLGRILGEVATQRQVIVTTNDAVFAKALAADVRVVL